MGEKKRKRKEAERAARAELEAAAEAAEAGARAEAVESELARLAGALLERIRGELEGERARDRELFALLRARLAALPTAAELRAEQEAWRARAERELSLRLRRELDEAFRERVERCPPSPEPREEKGAGAHVGAESRVPEPPRANGGDAREASRGALATPPRSIAERGSGDRGRWHAGVLLVSAALLFLGGWGLAALQDARDAASEVARAERDERPAPAPRGNVDAIALRAITDPRPSLEDAELERILDLLEDGSSSAEEAELARFALVRAADGTQWMRAKHRLAELVLADEASDARRALALGALAEREPEAAEPLAEGLLRSGGSTSLRAAAVDACAQLGTAVGTLEAIAADGADPLRERALLALARSAPSSAVLAGHVRGMLASVHDVESARAVVALLEALVEAPTSGTAEEEEEERAEMVREIVERLLKEPFQWVLERGEGEQVMLVGRGSAPGAAEIELDRAWHAPRFRTALGELLRGAAGEGTLAHLHARVDRLALPERGGRERNAIVRVTLGAGAAVRLRDGSTIAGDASGRRAELSIERTPGGAPLVAREPGGAWKSIAALEGAPAMRFEVVVDEP